MQMLPESNGSLSPQAVSGNAGLTQEWPYAAQLRPSGAGDIQDQRGVVECIRVLSRHKAALFVTALIGAILGYAFARSQRPMYESRVSIELQDAGTSFPSISRASQEAQPYAVLSDVQTQSRVLQSNKIALLAMNRVKAAGYAKDWEVKLAADSLRVRSTPETRIIDVIVASANPRLAADYANAVAEEFININTEQRLNQNARTTTWLRQQLDEMRRRLESSEHAMQAYARRAGLIFTGSAPDKNRSNISEDTLRQRQLALSAAIADRASKQAKSQIAATGTPDEIPEVMNDPTLRDYQTQLTEIRRQVAELSTVYTGDFSKIKRLLAQIPPLEASFNRQRAAVIARIKNEYQEAAERERLLSGDYQAQATSVGDESEKAVHYQILAREVDSNRQIYDAMLHRIRESGIDAALKASNISVLDPATVPIIPVRPNKRMSTMIGLLTGLVFCAGFVIIRSRSDRSIKAPGETLPWLNVPELGIIPSFSSQRGLRAGQLLGLQRNSVMMAESFRVVLASLFFSSGDSNGSGPGRVLVFTSTSPADGKTTIAANVAIALSNIGERVLLIDADLSRPCLHHMFNTDNERGLTTLLQSPAINEDMIRETIRETESGVFLIPAGPQLSEAADLLFAGQMPELLTRFKAEYDCIVIDTPPTPQLSHARLLGKLADGVVLVLRAGRTSRDAAIGAVQRLFEDRIHVLGTVLNDWNPKKAPSEYYGNMPRMAYTTEPNPARRALMRVAGMVGSSVRPGRWN